MNKKINTNPHCFLSVIGLSGSGKTYHEYSSTKRSFSNPASRKFCTFINISKQYESLLLGCTREKVSIEFHQGLHWTAVDRSEAEKLKTLVVIDDLNQDACEDGTFLNLVVAGRHRKIHLMTLRHNIYQPAKNWKTIDLYVTQMILFKSPRDVEQIRVLGRQLGDRKVPLEAYKRATSKPFGHLMIDLDPQTDPKLKYSSNCSGDQPSVFYISSTLTKKIVNNESAQLLYS